MLFRLINTILISVLFADMLEKRYPDEFKEFIISLSFNCIYLFSKLQIIITINNNKFNKFIADNPLLFKLRNDINNIFIQKSKKNYIEKTDFNFSILNIMQNNVVYKKIIYDDNYEETFDISDIKFIMLEFYFGETLYNKYKIDLKTDKFDYYIVGNKFTKDFFIFYLKHHLNINYSISNNDKYSIKIIDNDVNTYELHFTEKNESITLDKINYISDFNLHN